MVDGTRGLSTWLNTIDFTAVDSLCIVSTMDGPWFPNDSLLVAPL